MHDKHLSDRFLFASFGCCISTESYAWIAVVLFIFAIFVLLFCMLATAVVRWMYKRRMRKRLQQMKDKLTRELNSLRENEARLAAVAMKGQEKDSQKKEIIQARDDDVVIQPISIFIDTNKNYGANAISVPVRTPDNDPTPIAQSTLGDTIKSNGSVNPVPVQPETIVEMPVTAPTKSTNAESSPNMLKTPTPITGLAPPTTTTSRFSRTSNQKPGDQPLVRHVNHTFSSHSSELSNDIPIKVQSVTQANVRTETPKTSAVSNPSRPGAAGDRSFSSYKSTTTGFSRSWLVDSTGTDRQSTSTPTNDYSSVSKTNSLFKTDTSSYKTAKNERFTHGAFVFEK